MARIIFYVFIFISGYIASRELTTERFGELHYVTFLINVLWMFTNLGIPNVLSRYFPQAFQHQHPGSILQLLKVAVIAFILTGVLVGFSFYYFFEKAAIVLPLFPLMVFACSQFLLTYLNVFIQSIYRYRTTFWMNVIACIAGTLCLYLTIPVYGALAYIWSFVLVHLILSAGYIVTISKAIKDVKPAKSDFVLPGTPQLLKVALYFAVSAILAGMVWQRFELSILKNYFDYAHLALYGVAFTVIALFAEPLKLIPGVLLYYFANMGDKHREASEQFELFFKHFCWLVIFIGTFIWFDAEHIITLLYTDKYVESAYYVKILLPGIIPGVCSYALMSTHVGLGKARFLLIQDILTATIFLGLAFGLIHTFGLEGAAWAKSLAIGFSVTTGLLYTHFRLKYAVPFQSLFLSVVFSMLLVAPFQETWSETWILIVVKFLVAFILYCIISWYTRTIDQSVVRKLMGRRLRD
ncbi:MAG: polysaccharide biosynthesis C-terminal domain-containing protein [Bacteroidota bacterium]